MEIIWGIISFSTNVLEIYILFKFMNAVLTSKFPHKISALVLLILTVLTYLISEVEFVQYEYFETFKTLFILIMTFFFIHFLFSGSIGKKILSWLLLLVINLAIEGVIIFLMLVIMDIPIEFIATETMYQFVTIVITKLIFLVTVTLYANREKHTHFKVKHSLSMSIRIISMLLFLMVLILLFLSFFRSNSDEEDPFLGLIIISLALVSILAVSIYESILNQAKKQMEISLINQQNDMQVQYLEEIQMTINDMRGLKHDLNNHFSVLKGLLYHKQYEDLNQYIEKLSLPIKATNEIIFLTNPAISALIYSKIQAMKNNGITINLETDVFGELMIDELDLCIIFGNILDNAAEASLKLNEKERQIDLTIRMRNDQLRIQCTNKMNTNELNKKDGHYLSTKINKNLHGIGLKNVLLAVNRNSGTINIETRDDQFFVEISVANK